MVNQRPATLVPFAAPCLIGGLALRLLPQVGHKVADHPGHLVWPGALRRLSCHRGRVQHRGRRGRPPAARHVGQRQVACPVPSPCPQPALADDCPLSSCESMLSPQPCWCSPHPTLPLLQASGMGGPHLAAIMALDVLAIVSYGTTRLQIPSLL